jgi:hypothetical protein
MTFFGTQPTLTQVPPSLSASMMATRFAVLRRLFGNREAAAAAADGDEIEVIVHCGTPNGSSE